MHLADNPFFVDSRLTPGIQVADMVAGVIRIYQENELNRHIPQGIRSCQQLHAITG
ncbi:MAG: DUF3800 domain-containing protein [Chloroflexi bacterium]|nr:DUF3800 domain-containing protein [Chloroflexota bacterium]